MTERGRLPEAKFARSLPFERILVTGADGFVGNYLMPRLNVCVAADAGVWLATRSPQLANEVYLALDDATAVHAAVERVRPDLIIHLAAQSSVGASSRTAGETWSINHAGSSSASGC